MSEDIEYYRELLSIKRKRLQALEKKAAYQGVETPISILMEISDIKSALEELELVIKSSDSDKPELRLRNDLINKEISDLVDLVQNGVYTQKDLEEFIINKGEMSSLRLLALEVYLGSSFRNEDVFRRVFTDVDQNIRSFTLQMLRRYNVEVSQETLASIFRDQSASNDVLTYAVKLAYDLVKKSVISPDIFNEERVINNSYWVIRADAISAIIAADSPASVSLLALFYKARYWKSRRKICDYFEKLQESGKLKGADVDAAKLLLERFMNDGNSSDGTIKRMRGLLEKISAR